LATSNAILMSFPLDIPWNYVITIVVPESDIKTGLVDDTSCNPVRTRMENIVGVDGGVMK